MKSDLKIEKLTQKFGDKIALDDVDLEISATGVTALLGANGAGKTTLINCILGLLKPSHGKITLFGKPPGEQESKQQIGVMLQDCGLPDLLTGREHIELFSSYFPRPYSADQIIQQCDLHNFIDQRYKKLSGGQKRRIQFALAIIGKPKIVFLDEPTTGLDINARKLVWSIINDLSASGTAVVLCTHYLEEAESLADHTIVMSQGSVIANDSTDNIRAMASGALIRCHTHLESDVILGLNQVRSVDKNKQETEIWSNNATASLMDLLKLDPNLSNLSVRKSSLEDAFVQLTNSQHS